MIYAPPFIQIIPWAAYVDTVGTWVNFQSSTVAGGVGFLNGSAAQNDSITFTVPMQQGGVYDICIVGSTGNNQGIATVTIDGATVGTIDTYSAGSVLNVHNEVSGVTVDSTGIKELKLTMATKNPSSSAYIIGLSAISVTRTDDAVVDLPGVENLPHRVDIYPWCQSEFSETGTWNITASGTALGAIYENDTADAQNDELTWQVALDAGTWDLTSIFEKGPNEAIQTWKLNGTSIGTIDGYDAGGSENNVTAITGFTVDTPGIYTLQCIAETRNGSSAGWQLGLQHIVLQRTGA